MRGLPMLAEALDLPIVAPDPAPRPVPSLRIGIGWGQITAGGAQAGAHHVVRFANAVERLGFDALWLSEGPGRRPVAALSLLAAASTSTRTLRLRATLAQAETVATRLPAIKSLARGRLGVVARPSAEPRRGCDPSLQAIREALAGEGEIWTADATSAGLSAAAPLVDGWLAEGLGPAELGRLTGVVTAAARRAGREPASIAVAATIFALAGPDEIDGATARALERHPGLRSADYVATGLDHVEALIERFAGAGATDLVLVPVARSLEAWIEALAARVQVVHLTI